MVFFNTLSPSTQIVLLFVGIAILFLAVFSNSKKNKNKLYNGKRRSFRDNYYDRKKKEK